MQRNAEADTADASRAQQADWECSGGTMLGSPVSAITSCSALLQAGLLTFCQLSAHEAAYQPHVSLSVDADLMVTDSCVTD